MPPLLGLPPSRPSGHPVRWRPRRLSFRRVLPAFQAFRPAGPTDTSAAILPAAPGRSIAPGPFAQIRRRRARPPVFPRLPSALQASRPAGPVEASPVTLPAHPGHRSGPLSGRSGGALARHPSSASWPPLSPSVQLHRRRARRLVIQHVLPAFQAFRPAGPMETSAAGDPARPGHRSGLPSGSIDGELATPPRPLRSKDPRGVFFKRGEGGPNLAASPPRR